jgi:hypothetical protein
VAKKTWCVPELTDEFRERMEDVLDQYEKPFDPSEPVICLDEQPYQMVDDVRPPQWVAPGKIAKQDYEYCRCGTCSVFVAVEPQAGKRFARAKRHRKRGRLRAVRPRPLEALPQSRAAAPGHGQLEYA